MAGAKADNHVISVASESDTGDANRKRLACKELLALQRGGLNIAWPRRVPARSADTDDLFWSCGAAVLLALFVTSPKRTLRNEAKPNLQEPKLRYNDIPIHRGLVHV